MKKITKTIILILTSLICLNSYAEDFKTIARCEIKDGPINKGHKISLLQFGVNEFNNRLQPLSGLKLVYPEFQPIIGELKSSGFYVSDKHRTVTFDSEVDGVKASLSLSKPLYRIKKNFRALLTLVLPPNDLPLLSQEIFNFELKCKVKAEL